MARNDASNNGKKFQFQMGWSGIAAIFFSTVCVLLWVFVLGFWSGQRITEKKYAQGAFIQQAQPVMPEPSVPPPAPETQPSASAKSPPVAAVPLEPVTQDQLAQEQPIKPEVAEPIKQAKPEIKEEKHEAPTVAKPAVEKPKTPVAAAVAPKDQKATPPPDTSKKDTKAISQSSEIAKVEEKIKKLEEKKAAASHAEPQKTAAPKADTKATSSGSYYALQVAAFKDKAQAEAELKKFESKGFKGKIKTVDLGPEKGVWTRVYIGRYDTPEKAKAAQNELASQGHSKPSYVVMLQD